MKRRLLFLSLFCLGLLAACSAVDITPPSNPENPDNPGDSEDFIKGGGVGLTEITVPGVPRPVPIAGSGTFFEFAGDFSAPSDPYAAIRDTCVVGSGGGTPTPPDPVPPPSGEPTSLDAGASLSVKQGDSVYLELTKQGTNPISYVGSTPASLPDAELTLDIPGAEFPAMSASFGNVARFELTGPTDKSAMTRDTTFTWTSSSAGVVLLTMSQSDATGSVNVFCFAADDGSFSFSAQTKAELDAAELSRMQLNSGGRLVWRLEQKDDTFLSLTTVRTVGYSGANLEHLQFIQQHLLSSLLTQ